MREMKKYKVELEGLSPIMFNRFIDHSKEMRPPEQKLYLDEKNRVVLPAANIESFLFGSIIPGCAKTFEGKKSKDYIRTGQTHISIKPILIPFTRDGKPIVFKTLEDTKLWGINMEGGLTKGSGGTVIKQPPQPRPYLKTPWELVLDVVLVKNNIIDVTKLANWFENGGILIALGTHRPVWGRFIVKSWEES
jgi:hypothetical protein